MRGNERSTPQWVRPWRSKLVNQEDWTVKSGKKRLLQDDLKSDFLLPIWVGQVREYESAADVRVRRLNIFNYLSIFIYLVSSIIREVSTQSLWKSSKILVLGPKIYQNSNLMKIFGEILVICSAQSDENSSPLPIHHHLPRGPRPGSPIHFPAQIPGR